MTINYDPELPFVVYAPGSNEVNSRFKYENEALTHRNTATWLEVIDTTPQPKIPEDAEFIIWRSDPSSALQFAEKTQGFWAIEAVEVSDEELISEIGDAEVTVLVRKEDS